MTIEKTIEQQAEQIINDRLKHWNRGIDAHSLRFAKAAVAEALHSGVNIWGEMYQRAKNAERENIELRNQLIGFRQQSKTPAPKLPCVLAFGLALLVAAVTPAVADVRDPVTTVCPEGTIKRQDFAGFKTDKHGRMLVDEVGQMSIHIDVWCRPIMPPIAKLPPVEVRHER